MVVVVAAGADAPAAGSGVEAATEVVDEDEGKDVVVVDVDDDVEGGVEVVDCADDVAASEVDDVGDEAGVDVDVEAPDVRTSGVHVALAEVSKDEAADAADASWTSLATDGAGTCVAEVDGPASLADSMAGPS